MGHTELAGPIDLVSVSNFLIMHLSVVCEQCFDYGLYILFMSHGHI